MSIKSRNKMQKVLKMSLSNYLGAACAEDNKERIESRHKVLKFTLFHQKKIKITFNKGLLVKSCRECKRVLDSQKLKCAKSEMRRISKKEHVMLIL